MRQKIAAAIVVLLILSAVIFFNNKAGGPVGTEQEGVAPEQTVTALYDACSRGDTEAYLKLVGGPLEAQARQALRQQGDEAFARSLKQTVKGLKGVAVRRIRRSPQGGWVVEAELVFANRIETQNLELVLQQGRWVVLSRTQAQIRKPSIPYGTPVFEE